MLTPAALDQSNRFQGDLAAGFNAEGGLICGQATVAAETIFADGFLQP